MARLKRSEITLFFYIQEDGEEWEKSLQFLHKNFNLISTHSAYFPFPTLIDSLEVKSAETEPERKNNFLFYLKSR